MQFANWAERLRRSRRWSHSAVAALAIALGGAVAGCAGDGPPAETATSTFDLVQRDIFDVRCATGGCHDSATAGGLNLESGRSFANLVGVSPVNRAAAAAGLQLVVPFDPERSFLLVKLTSPGPGEGSRMPLNGAALSPADIDLVRSWITDGASGSSLPSPTPEPTFTATALPTVSQTPLPSATPTISATPTVTATGTLHATVTATATPSTTATATSTTTPTIDPESTFTRLQETLFTPRCAVMFCHDSQTLSGNLVLEAGSSYAALVGAAPDNDAARQRGWQRVDAGHPDTSYLLVKLTLAKSDAQLGSPMPLVGDRVPAEQIDRVRAWILRGAPND